MRIFQENMRVFQIFKNQLKNEGQTCAFFKFSCAFFKNSQIAIRRRQGLWRTGSGTKTRINLATENQRTPRYFQTLINTDLHGIFALRRPLGTLNSKLVPYLQVNLPSAHHFEFYCCAICLKAITSSALLKQNTPMR